MTQFGRALFLGGLAGLLAAVGYVVIIGIHAIACQSGYSVYLGGSAVFINGVPHVELPKFVFFATLLGTALWGVLLARVVNGSYRPVWWKAAPLMWVSIIVSLLVGYLVGYSAGKYSIYLVPGGGYASFGALFGSILRSARAALILFFVCPLTYVAALSVESLLPVEQIVGTLTNCTPIHMSFLHVHESFDQTMVWLIHGVAMGGVIWLIGLKKGQLDGGRARTETANSAVAARSPSEPLLPSSES